VRYARGHWGACRKAGLMTQSCLIHPGSPCRSLQQSCPVGPKPRGFLPQTSSAGCCCCSAQAEPPLQRSPAALELLQPGSCHGAG
jgi:hypothetical protein